MKKTKKKEKLVKPVGSVWPDGVTFVKGPLEQKKQEPESSVPTPLKEPPRLIFCTNRHCNHCVPGPANGPVSRCNQTILHLNKVWNGSEEEWRLLCMEATNKTDKHNSFESTTAFNSQSLNQKETQ